MSSFLKENQKGGVPRKYCHGTSIMVIDGKETPFENYYTSSACQNRRISNTNSNSRIDKEITKKEYIDKKIKNIKTESKNIYIEPGEIPKLLNVISTKTNENIKLILLEKEIDLLDIIYREPDKNRKIKDLFKGNDEAIKTLYSILERIGFNIKKIKDYQTKRIDLKGKSDKIKILNSEMQKSCYRHISQPERLDPCLKFLRFYKGRTINSNSDIVSFMTVGIFKQIYGPYDPDASLPIVNNNKYWCNNNPLNMRKCAGTNTRPNRLTGKDREAIKTLDVDNIKKQFEENDDLKKIKGPNDLLNKLEIISAQILNPTHYSSLGNKNNNRINLILETIKFIFKYSPNQNKIEIYYNDPNSVKYILEKIYKRKSNKFDFLLSNSDESINKRKKAFNEIILDTDDNETILFGLVDNIQKFEQSVIFLEGGSNKIYCRGQNSETLRYNDYYPSTKYMGCKVRRNNVEVNNKYEYIVGHLPKEISNFNEIKKSIKDNTDITNITNIIIEIQEEINNQKESMKNSLQKEENKIKNNYKDNENKDEMWKKIYKLRNNFNEKFDIDTEIINLFNSKKINDYNYYIIFTDVVIYIILNNKIKLKVMRVYAKKKEENIIYLDYTNLFKKQNDNKYHYKENGNIYYEYSEFIDLSNNGQIYAF